MKKTCTTRSTTSSIAAACAVAIIWAVAPPSGTARAEDSPRVVVQNVTDAVLAVLGDKTLTSDQKRGRIEDIVYANVDFATLSRLVLARNWSRFSDAQREDFTNEFKRHLSVTYGKNVENYRNERVAILGDREEARGDWTVQTKILRGGPDDILVDYRLRRADNRWTIIDFIVEGVSLVSNFRAQFQEIIASGGVDKLLQLLREKNATGEPLKS